MVSKIQGFISQINKNHQSLPILQEYRESFIFTLCIIFTCLEAPYFFIFRLVGAVPASNLAIILIIANVCCIVLRRFYFVTGFFVTSIPVLSLLYYGSLFGKEVGAHSLCLSFLAVSFAIYTTKHPYYLTLSCLVPISVLFILEFSDYSLVPRFELGILQTKIIALSANITTRNI